jgi:hypothetical protein
MKLPFTKSWMVILTLLAWMGQVFSAAPAMPNLSTNTAPTTSVSAMLLPGLSVSGINIVANGQPIRLRGVNMGDPFGARNPDWYPMYSTADYADIAQNWGANVVRISIFPTQWKNMDHVTLLAGLAQEVNAALDSGLYVIISYHGYRLAGWLVPGRVSRQPGGHLRLQPERGNLLLDSNGADLRGGQAHHL